MDKKLKKSLNFMMDNCPHDIKLNNYKRFKDDNGFVHCELNCLECWCKALDINIKELIE